MQDGKTYRCRKCGYLEKEEKEETRMTYEKGASLSAVNLLSCGEVGRNIRQDTAEKFGVKIGFDTGTGEPDTHYYPYTKEGKVVSYKVRRLPKSFSIVGSSKGAELFGQSLCTAGGNRLVICAGEIDAMSAFQILGDYTNEKYPGRGITPQVVSLPNGESVSGLADNFGFIDSYKEIILCMDMDDQGRKAVESIASYLARPNIKVMSLTEKDVNDLLVKGKKQEFIKQYFEAVAWTPRGFDTPSMAEIQAKKDKGYSIPFPELQQKIEGVRKGEIFLMTAGSGVGKSTLAREIAHHLMFKHKVKVGNMFLEETQADTYRTYIAMNNNIQSNMLSSSPELLSEEKWKRDYDYLNEYGTFFRHFGSLSDKDLMDKLRYMVKVKGCEFIILDHISMVISGRDASAAGERKDIDVLMTNLAQFVVDHNVGIIAISHLTRDKEKNWNGGDIPDLRNLRGSGALEQLSWTIVALARDQRGDLPNVSTIHVLKNRTFGKVGPADTCSYDYTTGRLIPIPDTKDY
jgi:twinkle protein